MNKQIPPATQSFIEAIEAMDGARQMATLLLMVEHISSSYLAQEFQKTHEATMKMVNMCWDWLERKRDNLDQIDLWFHQGPDGNPMEIEFVEIMESQVSDAYGLCITFIGCVVDRCYVLMDRIGEATIVGDLTVLDEQIGDIDIRKFFSPEILAFLGLSKGDASMPPRSHGS